MSKTLDEFQGEVGGWGDVTFPQSTTETVVAHFREEVDEFCWDFENGQESQDEELADVFLLMLHFAHKCGISLFEQAERKMAINRGRTWKTTPEPAGHTKHEVVPS